MCAGSEKIGFLDCRLTTKSQESHRTSKAPEHYSRNGSKPNTDAGLEFPVVVLADAGHAVLLVDGDLRMPSLDVLFAQPATPGLTQILAGEAEIAARPTAHPNLHLMPAGGTPSNPAELLAGSCLQEWLAFCRHSHPVVVIDGPPADVADTVELARYSDALLLAVRSGWTRRSDVAAALDRLSSFRPRLLGAVLAPPG